jgi:hypothetical protein
VCITVVRAGEDIIRALQAVGGHVTQLIAQYGRSLSADGPAVVTLHKAITDLHANDATDQQLTTATSEGDGTSLGETSFKLDEYIMQSEVIANLEVIQRAVARGGVYGFTRAQDDGPALIGLIVHDFLSEVGKAWYRDNVDVRSEFFRHVADGNIVGYVAAMGA